MKLSTLEPYISASNPSLIAGQQELAYGYHLKSMEDANDYRRRVYQNMCAGYYWQVRQILGIEEKE